MLAGIVVLAVPGLSLLGLAVILGIRLVVFGVMEMTLAFRVRRARRGAARIIEHIRP